jgi:putative oxidoreductase
MTIGLALMRIVLGAFVAAHGFQKLTRFWGGGGLEASSAEFRDDGFRGGKVTAFVASMTQLGSGILLILGLLTPLASAGAIAVMTIAVIVKLHVGFWSQNGGFEYPILLTILGIATAFAGPGSFSVDGLLGLTAYWTGWVSAAAAAAGVLGSFATYAILHRRDLPVETRTVQA